MTDYLQENSPKCLLDRSLAGTRLVPNVRANRKVPPTSGISITAVKPVANHFTKI
jgi:hypothetical protein